MQKLISMIILFVTFSISTLAINKDQVLEKIKSKLDNFEMIQLNVEAVGSGLTGSIKAEKGNKYKMIFGDRQLVSDGKSIWNYSKPDNQVLISKYQENSNSGIETVFFDIVNNMEAKSFSKILNSKNGNSYKLVLKDKRNTDQIILELDENYEIKLLEMSQYNEVWKILKLDISKEKSDSEYNFNIPEDAETIDMR
ncbi:outer-membrane lipoprotein carrier protein LolA [Candidatus Kapabacteria bacterium]|nr:outer-membrane lipoprotein carrier protein LolA [Candidatus Kapabacteria bacterium]